MASSSSYVCARCSGERLQERPDLVYCGLWSLTQLPEPSACSGCWTTTGLHSPGHGIGVQEVWWGTRAVPNKSEWPQPQRLSAAELWLCIAFSSWSSAAAGGTWIWALRFTCTESGSAKGVDRSGACSHIIKLLSLIHI